MIKTLAFSTLLILAAGCATGSHVITGQARAMISPEAVQIYSATPKNADILGTVSVTCPSGFQHYLTHPELQILKEQAADLGANGLVLGDSTIHVFVGYQQSGLAIFVH